jgi:hypothetical protein
VTGVLAVHVIHENPEWYPPLAAAFDAAAVPHREWLVGTGQPGAGLLDLAGAPPEGVFWSRMSASSASRGHPFAKDQTRAMLTWLEAHGRRVVNGRRVLDLEMSKAEQLSRLRAAGLDVPRTVAVAGDTDLPQAASMLPVPFISKHDQGGKGVSVRLFVSHDEYAAYLSGPDYLPSPDGITLLQEYLWPAEPHITRVEIVGGEFVYAITRRYEDFARRHGIEIAGFEFIETADGRLVTYDINATTNYNAAIEAAAPRAALPAAAQFFRRLLDES